VFLWIKNVAFGYIGIEKSVVNCTALMLCEAY